ncbi:MAG: hypothetical protein ACXVA4_12405, partial [Ktedonobacterales bacterium]
PPRQPGHHQAPPTPSAGPFPSPVMPIQRDADAPNQRVAEHRARWQAALNEARQRASLSDSGASAGWEAA